MKGRSSMLARWVRARRVVEGVIRRPVGWLCVIPSVVLFLELCVATVTHGQYARHLDSAGVRVIENHRSDPVERWVASSDPFVVLGVEGSGPYLFRVAGAVQLQDGSIAVANGGTSQLVLYDRQGQCVATSGRTGSGPGEFRMLTWLHRWHEGVVAYDLTLRRLSWFDGRGTFLRSAQIPATAGAAQPAPIGFLDDSTVALHQAATELMTEGPSRIERLPANVYRYKLGGAAPSRLITVPGLEVTVTPQRGGGGPGWFLRYERDFGVTTMYATAGGQLVVADTERPELRVFDPRGRLVGMIRLDGEPRRISGSDVAKLRESRLAKEEDPEARSLWERYFQEAVAQPSEYFPAMDDKIIVDVEGRLWIADYHWPVEESVQWFVFSLSGELVATVLTPPGLLVTDATSEYVLGIWKDTDGVEFIHGYRLLRDESRI